MDIDDLRLRLGYSARWLDQWIEHPDSEARAAALNEEQAQVCPHNRDPCYLRCGVEIDHLERPPTWTPIPYEKRLAWRERVVASMERDMARQRARP